jgi:hypothetical protein
VADQVECHQMQAFMMVVLVVLVVVAQTKVLQ